MTEIFAQQLRMLCDIAIIKVLYPKIDDDLEQISEVEQGEIHTVGGRSYLVLHTAVNSEDEKRLD